jgi:hypothetical protein
VDVEPLIAGRLLQTVRLTVVPASVVLRALVHTAIFPKVGCFHDPNLEVLYNTHLHSIFGREVLSDLRVNIIPALSHPRMEKSPKGLQVLIRLLPVSMKPKRLDLSPIWGFIVVVRVIRCPSDIHTIFLFQTTFFATTMPSTTWTFHDCLEHIMSHQTCVLLR